MQGPGADERPGAAAGPRRAAGTAVSREVRRTVLRDGDAPPTAPGDSAATAPGVGAGSARSDGGAADLGPPPAAAGARRAGDGPAWIDLEARVATVGAELRARFDELIGALPGAPRRTQALATALGVDKVLASRLLKAVQSPDPIATVHRAPGPAPLRRVLDRARRAGVAGPVVEAAARAADDFERLVKVELGDRGYLDAILSAWVPEARSEFELRSKQAAWRAMSQLLGASAETLYSAAIFAPAHSAPGRIDIVWLLGVLGLRRLRPGAKVRLSTRRVAGDDRPRHPRTLEGVEVDSHDVEGLRLDRFVGERPAPVSVARAGDAVHYTLGGEAFGPGTEVDLILGELNESEIPAHAPRGSTRRGYAFSEVAPPARRLIFDVLIDEAVYPGRAPELLIYDTSFDGVADVNDPARDVDRLDLSETVLQLGRGLDRFRAGEVPNHATLLRHVFERTGRDPARFRGYRARIDFPVYGSQVALAFEVPEADGEA